MLIDGLMLTDTSNISNMKTERGDTFPSNPSQGRMFYLTVSTNEYQQGQYFFDGNEWVIGDISSVDIESNGGLLGGGTRGDISLSVDPAKFTSIDTFTTHVNDTQKHLSVWAAALIAGLNTQLTSTHLNHLVGVTSNVQNQLNSKLNLSGGTITGQLFLAGDPQYPLAAATKQYVDNKVLGIDAKSSVRVVATTNQTLTGLPIIDGYQVAPGDRVLLTAQTDKKLNGIYDAAGGTWTRSQDANNNVNFTVGLYVFVEAGDTYKASAWVLAGTAAIDLGISELTFVQFTGTTGSYGAGAGLILTGNTFNIVAADSSRINVTADAIDLGFVGNPGNFNRVSVDSYGRVMVGTLEAYLTENQTITVTGDATGTGKDSIALTLAASGVTAGTYKSVTVDAKGRVTGGTNPTTLSGYGITDAVPTTHIGSGGTQHANATTSVAGFMSSADKTKLDGLSSGATGNTYGSITDGTNTAAPSTPNDVLRFLTGNSLLSVVVTNSYVSNDDAVTLTVNESNIQIGNISGVLGITKGGTGATTQSAARVNLGLGTMATQDSANVTITGGTIDGVTIDGGTF